MITLADLRLIKGFAVGHGVGAIDGKPIRARTPRLSGETIIKSVSQSIIQRTQEIGTEQWSRLESTIVAGHNGGH